MFKISGPSVHWNRIFSYESPESPPRSLVGHSSFLNRFLMTMDVKKDMYKHLRSSVQNFKPLGTLEEDIVP